MEYPDRKIDVHLGTDGNDFQCQECHQTKNHNITGQAMVVSPGGKDHIGCEKRHEAAPTSNRGSAIMRQRWPARPATSRTSPRRQPTKLSWDWSTAGKDISPEPIDKLGKPTYDKKKGDFTWGKMVVPTYAWYNGTAGAYLTGDKMDPTKVTKLTYPKGDIKDKAAKIYPVKTHTGKHIYDSKNNIFITPKVFGAGGYWKDFDWGKAAKSAWRPAACLTAASTGSLRRSCTGGSTTWSRRRRKRWAASTATATTAAWTGNLSATRATRWTTQNLPEPGGNEGRPPGPPQTCEGPGFARPLVCCAGLSGSRKTVVSCPEALLLEVC